MPEIINIFFKINLAYINYIEDNNGNSNIAQSSLNEIFKKYIYLLNKFKKDVEINKIKIIIPQLITCFQYEKTYLYDFAVDLLTLYGEKNIDLIGFLLSSYLSFNENNNYMNLNSHIKYNNAVNIYNQSKNFVSLITKIKYKKPESFIWLY